MLRAGFAEFVGCAELSRAEDSLSEASEGIWRLSLGRAPDLEPDVSERCGGGNSIVGLEERDGGGGLEVGTLILGPTVMERGGGLMSGEGESRLLS